MRERPRFGNGTVIDVEVSDEDARRRDDWHDAYEKAQLERERRKRIAFLRDKYPDDHDSFFRALGHDEWLLVLKELAELKAPSPALRTAFLRAWTKIDVFPHSAGDAHPQLITVARLMLPPYDGPGVHLFRGCAWVERQRRAYGVSWTDDCNAAEKFAQGSRKSLWPGGGAVLETFASPTAIISQIEYHRGLAKYRWENEFVVRLPRPGARDRRAAVPA